jgi:hypothetical protein
VYEWCIAVKDSHNREQQLQTLVSHMSMKSVEKLAVDNCHFAACEIL